MMFGGVHELQELAHSAPLSQRTLCLSRLYAAEPALSAPTNPPLPGAPPAAFPPEIAPCPQTTSPRIFSSKELLVTQRGVVIDSTVPSTSRPDDTAPYEVLVAHYYTPVYRYLLRLVRDPDLAADLTQDTFTKASMHVSRRSCDAPFHAWLFRIATNEARQFFRRQRRITWLPWDAWVWEGGSGDIADTVSEHLAVEHALAQLSPQARACLLLHAWGGLSCKEIGAAIGKSEAATKKIVLRARHRFREVYDKEER